MSRYSKHIFFSRGRVGLYALMKGLSIGSGDEVISQAFTCVAVPESIIAIGAKPVYVDLERGGFNMSLASLESALTPQTKLVIVQHTFGIVAEIAKIAVICEQYGVPLVEDCCHTHDSTCDGYRVGSFGVGAFYSYEWGKPVVAGIGGSLLLNDEKLSMAVETIYQDFSEPSVLDFGRIMVQKALFDYVYSPTLYWYVKAGFRLGSKVGLLKGNYNPISVNRLPGDYRERMASQLVRMLKRDEGAARRFAERSEEIVEYYRDQLQDVKRLILPRQRKGNNDVFVRYPLRVEGKARLLEQARKSQIEVGSWYSSPVHPIQRDKLEQVGYRLGSCPEAERRCLEIVSLPTNLKVKQADLERSCNFLQEEAW